MNRRLAFLLAFLVVWTTSASLVGAPPQIAQIDPLAVAPGKSVELVIRGQNLLAPRSLWTTFAARCEFLSPADESVQKGEKLVCRVTVPRDEQVGLGAMRVVTGEGVSNPLLIMLDDLPTIAEATDSHAATQAQQIQLPIAIDGQCEPVQEDFWRFHADAGQHVSFEVVSQRLGSKLDPVLRLLNADGKEVLRLDDAKGSGGDSRFAHTFESDGDYLLALSDVRHLGGSDYRYRLRVGSFPLVTAVYPLGGRSGAVMSFELTGYGTNPLAKLHVAVPDTHKTNRLAFFSVPTAGNAGSGWFQVEAGPGSEWLEQEPNDNISEATQAQFPGVLNGRLSKPGDRDCFKFTAKKGQRVHCVAKTRELGSPCDVNVILHKADGTKLAEARQDRQAVLDAEIPDDGDYTLQVDDLIAGGAPGPDHVYRIDASEAYSGFSVQAEALQYSAPQGGTFTVKVLAKRQGYNGPIELTVDGLGEGVTLAGNTFDGGETPLKITLPANIPAGDVRLATIIGKAKVGEQMVSVPMDQREPLRAVFPNAVSLPTKLIDSIAIGVGPPFPPYFEISLASSEVYFPQLVGTSNFDVNISRTNDAFKEAVNIVVEGLPAGITTKVAPVGDGLKAVRVSLAGPADLAEVEFPIRITGSATFQDQSRKVVLTHVKLRVTKPLVVSVAMPGPVVAGGEQQAEVKLQRFGDDPQPVRLHVSDGPAGLAAPIFVNVAKDVDQVKIPITAVSSATPGKFENLIVVATTVVKGQNVIVQSKPATIEIQAAPAK
jgi:hypothetical protein